MTVLSTSVAMISLLCLWMVFQLVFLGGLSHGRDQDLLYRDFRTQLASAIAPVGPVVPAGDPVAVLTAPRIGLQQTVVEGTGSADTLAGPGHLRNTVLPGQSGTSVMMGRAQTYGGPFASLGSLVAGDTITTVTGQGTTAFTVLGVRRAGDPLPQPLAAGSSRLTLVTSESSGARTDLASGSVLYVDADAATAFPAPAGLPASVPDSERPLATDSGVLPLLVLHLAALLALTLGIVAARQRWAGPLVWVIATPVALAAAWSTTDVAMRLLPNLL
ncbi:MAG: sortase [Nocardioides sp.]|nr:sortase [Nocardioides sp.]